MVVLMQGLFWWQLGGFAAALAFFHASEFALAALLMPRDQLSARSLLCSRAYAAAMALGLAEHLLEGLWLAPRCWWKRGGSRAALAALLAGLALVLLGEALRKAAMLTARGAFTHDIARARRPEHQLVTRGVYRWARHPGYAGWLLWAVGTQVLLANPACAVLFAVLAWRFFRARVAYEEWTLRRLFGAEYDAYAARTPSGLPGIK